MIKLMKSLRFPLVVLLLSSVVIACSDDDPSIGPDPNNPYAETNAWIYDIMDEVYFWTDDLPSEESTNAALDPSDYFASLLSNEDRFSRIYPDYAELIGVLERVRFEAGYNFELFRDPQNENNVIALIRYVKRNGNEDSPAKSAGLRRSDAIYAINGQTMTLENYQSLLEEISSNHTVSYRRYFDDQGGYVDMGDLALTVETIQENPNLLDTVYSIGNNKIAYFHYRFFSDGPQSTNDFNVEMDNIFAKFNGQAITDLILDLRYNNGGTITSAQNLASLIAPNVDGTDIFYENVWNDFYMAYINTLDNADDILRGKFLPKAQNVGSRLAGNTVYILVDENSASATELVINGLIPYMNVELIGTTTVGKNVGSIPIEDTNNPENDYGMLPIVLKIFNSQGQSDYADGFTPVGADFIDEINYLWYPMGDVRDPLVSRAIEKITGSLPGRIPDELDSRLYRNKVDLGQEEDDLPVIFDNPFN